MLTPSAWLSKYQCICSSRGLEEALVATCMVSAYTNISGQWTCPSASSVGLRAPGPIPQEAFSFGRRRFVNYTRHHSPPPPPPPMIMQCRVEQGQYTLT